MDNEPSPKFPVAPQPGTKTAQFVHDHRHFLEPLAKTGLLEPASGAPISNADLPNLIEALSWARQAMIDVTRPVSSPLTAHPQIVDLLSQLLRELTRLKTGIDLPVLTVPPTIAKNKSALDPDRNRLRKTCVGYVDVLSLRMSKEAAYKKVSAVLKKNGLKGAKKTVESWYRIWSPVLDDWYRANGRFDLTDDYRMLEVSFPNEVDPLPVLEERLNKAVEHWARIIDRPQSPVATP